MFCEWPLIAISTVSSSPRQLLGGGWTKVTSERRKLDCQSGMHEIPPSNECRLRMVWFNVAVSGVILFGIFSPLSSYSIYYSGFNLFLIFCPLFYSIRWLLKALIKTRAQEYKVGGCKKSGTEKSSPHSPEEFDFAHGVQGHSKLAQKLHWNIGIIFKKN